ncbi:MFS transporter [Evansella tamaricis]|uniref:MFS transporter n=1 Tax=Evansella tamaricis TaxID=2069301 RepID=A0ABS6JGC6_9BACI|nr:MFS transporter [Evansella tamaricis]MBU9712646.1 MFS transporter [Evansella tamaricis]
MGTGKSKLILYFILFLIFVSIHMQFPVFTPLAVSLGAGSMLVALMLSVTSFVNLGGNLIAGSVIDRLGVRGFIVFPLFLLSISLFAHSFVTITIHLFILRVLNGFILAFLTPACMTMLASFAQNRLEQSKNMAMNTLMVTAAMTVAPVLGGWLGERYGADGAYYMISFTTFIAFLLAFYYLPSGKKTNGFGRKKSPLISLFTYPPLAPVFLTAFVMMYTQGTIMYELPFLSVESNVSKGAVGKMAGFIGLGTFFVLTFVFLHRISPKVRTIIGLLLMSISVCLMMFSGIVPPLKTFFLFGIASGMVFPAMMTLVTESIDEQNRGKAFAFLSAIFSVGTIISPFVSGLVRDYMSPYYIAWIVLMIVTTIIGLQFMTSKNAPGRPPHTTPTTKVAGF